MKIHAGFPFPAGGGQGITITGDAAEICYASGMECVCEAPVRFCSGVRVDAGFIGAFSFFNQQCSVRFVESIGRFGLFGPEVVREMEEKASEIRAIVDDVMSGGAR